MRRYIMIELYIILIKEKNITKILIFYLHHKSILLIFIIFITLQCLNILPIINIIKNRLFC